MKSTTERGYGYRHRVERRKWEPVVASGKATCSKCKLPIEPTDEWDLDHADDRLSYLGPAHRACNRAAGARNSTEARLAKQLTVRRDW